MTNWSIMTVVLSDETPKEGLESNVPIELTIDSGFGDRFFEDGKFHVVAYGRHQELRFGRFCEEFHSPWFTGVGIVSVCTGNDTGDVAEMRIYSPLQDYHDERVDGYFQADMFKADIFKIRDRLRLKRVVEDEYGFVPRIEPRGDVPPDTFLTFEGDYDQEG